MRIAIWIVVVFVLSARFTLAQKDSSKMESATSAQWYKNFVEQNKDTPIDALLQGSAKKMDDALDSPELTDDVLAYNEFGLVHLHFTSNYEKAMDNFVKAMALEDSLGLKEQRIFSYMSVARVFEKVGNYYRSAEFLEEALTLALEMEQAEVIAMIYNDLGRINAYMNNLQSAFELFQKVLEYGHAIDYDGIASAHKNLGDLYAKQKDFEKALESHIKGLQVIRGVKDRNAEAQALYEIGHLYWQMQNSERALANHVAALEIWQSLADKEGMAKAYNSIGTLYYFQQNYPRAIANLNLGLKWGQEAQAQSSIEQSYKYLSAAYKETNEYQRALAYQDLYIAISEFIQSEQDEHQLLEIQNRYNIEKTEAKIEGLELQRAKKEKELDKQKKFNSLLYVIISFVVIIVFLLLFLYFMNRRSNKILQVANKKVNDQNLELNELNATKDKFFSIISHDLKGPLNSLSSFSNLLINYTDSLSKEEIQTLAKDLDLSIKNLFSLLENLLEWSRTQTGAMEFKNERFALHTVLEENIALLAVQAQNKKIKLSLETKEEVEVLGDKNSIHTVVRNLISNAIKFTPENGAIQVGLSIEKEAYRVAIKDNGVGMSKEVMEQLFRIDTKHSTQGTANEKGTGLGLILCKEFVEKNGGKLWVESTLEQGSTFYFTLPIPD